jgi:putative redox protein
MADQPYRVVARAGASGYRTEVTVAQHTIIADEPVQDGGTDQGPTPYDLIVGALGACTAITLRMYAERKRWPLESVEVALRLYRDADEVPAIERGLRLVGLDDAQRARLADIAERTPVTLTLKAGVAIRTHLA